MSGERVKERGGRRQREQQHRSAISATKETRGTSERLAWKQDYTYILFVLLHSLFYILLLDILFPPVALFNARCEAGTFPVCRGVEDRGWCAWSEEPLIIPCFAPDARSSLILCTAALYAQPASGTGSLPACSARITIKRRKEFWG